MDGHVDPFSGWWYSYPSEKYEFVSWDYEIPNIWKNNLYGSKHCLRRYLTLQIIPQKLPKKELGSIGIKCMFQTTNQLYSPIINHYQPLLTMIDQDDPIY